MVTVEHEGTLHCVTGATAAVLRLSEATGERGLTSSLFPLNFKALWDLRRPGRIPLLQGGKGPAIPAPFGHNPPSSRCRECQNPS